MSDTTLNAFVASGTAAERAAFVPDPPTPVVGPDPGYFFFETDTGSTYAWDGAVWVIVANGSTGDVTGPASAVDDRIATFDGITGTLIQDGGSTIATVIADAVAGAVSSIVPVNLTTDVTGDLPYANLVAASAASRVLVRGSAGGAGDWQEGTLGSGLSLTGTVLSATGGTGDVVGPAASVDKEIALFDATTGKLLERATGTGIVRVTSGVYGTPGAVDLASEVTGDLPLSNLAQASAASRILGRGSASGSGDFQELTISTGLTLTGTTLTAAGAGGDMVGPASSVASEVMLFDGTTGKLAEAATGTGVARVTSGVWGTPGAVNLTSEVTGDLPLSNLAQASAASRLLGRGSASGAGDYQEVTLGSGLTMSGTALSASAAAAGPRTVGVTVDGGGSVVTTGAKGYIQCPITGTITKWTILANGTGNLTFGVKKDAFGSFPPTTSIVASAPPSMTGAASATQSSLGTWSLSVTAGDVFGFEITGTPTVITLATLQIEVTP